MRSLKFFEDDYGLKLEGGEDDEDEDEDEDEEAEESGSDDSMDNDDEMAN